MADSREDLEDYHLDAVSVSRQGHVGLFCAAQSPVRRAYPPEEARAIYLVKKTSPRCACVIDAAQRDGSVQEYTIGEGRKSKVNWGVTGFEAQVERYMHGSEKKADSVSGNVFGVQKAGCYAGVINH